MHTMAERVRQLEEGKGSTLRQRGHNAAGGSAAIATPSVSLLAQSELRLRKILLLHGELDSSKENEDILKGELHRLKSLVVRLRRALADASTQSTTSQTQHSERAELRRRAIDAETTIISMKRKIDDQSIEIMKLQSQLNSTQPDSMK